MYGSIKQVIFLSFCIYLVTGDALSEQLLQYTVLVIKHYERTSGWFRCVIYDLSAGTDNGWIRELLSSHQLRNVARYVLDEKFLFKFEYFRPKPSLTIVYVGDRYLNPWQVPDYVRLFFGYLDTNSRLMVLLNTENYKASQGIGNVLAIGQFDKITYVGTKMKRVIQMGLYGMAKRAMAYFPHPKDLIRSFVRNTHGHHVCVTYSIQPWYPAEMWALQTAKFLNTSLKFYPNVCAKAASPSDCVHKLFYNGYVDISLDHNDATQYLLAYFRMLFNVAPISRMILVPQGRPYNAVEIFTKPFAWETWAVLLLMLILIETISLIFPGLYENDPILLMVCGFEKYNLHRASTKEKVSLLPMIIFFCLMFNAYGTKIIAFMTDKPSVGNIKTLNELAKSGIKITADLKIDSRLANDSFLGPLMIHKPNSEDNLLLDGEHAHLSSNLEASFLVALSRNYDFKLQRPKYVVINEHKSTLVVTYWIGLKSPFAETFSYTQKVFFKAGLLDFWQDKLMNFVTVRDRAMFKGVEVDSSGMLSFDDLISNWIVLAIGLLASLIVLGVEFLIQFLKSIK